MNTLSTLKSTTLALTLAFGATSFHASAFDTDAIKEGQKPLAAEFKSLDVNTDGTLALDEAGKDKLFGRKNFNKADIDSDGTLDYDEYANFKSDSQKNNAKRVVSDSVLTSKIKAELLAERDFKSTQISVKTFKGDVIISGFVDDELSKAKAEAIVNKVEGVKSIKNSLVVKG